MVGVPGTRQQFDLATVDDADGRPVLVPVYAGR
jgi:hypothetical protein